MEEIKYNVNRVNKFNVMLIWVFAIVLTVQAMLTDGEKATYTIITCLAAGVFASIFMLFKVNDKIRAIVIPLIPAVLGTILTVFKGGSNWIFMVYTFVFCMAALYFDAKILVVIAVVVDVMFLVGTYVFKQQILSAAFTVRESVVLFVMGNASVVVLFFLAKWGNEHIKEATDKTNELTQTFSIIENTATTLNNNVADFTGYIENTQQSSRNIAVGMQQISQTTEHEAHDINKISEMVSEASEKLKVTNDQSKAIDDITKEFQLVVEDNGREIDDLKGKMLIIHDAVEKALNTVTNLGESMKEIQAFVDSITKIAKQTNLLAINAAIEAARAGEAGKGFTVVADEIRLLSDESNKTANEIKNILISLQNNADNVAIDVSAGFEATTDGSNAVNVLGESVESMQSSFGNLRHYIETQYKSINDITELFIEIEKYIVSNAAIMEEQSASTEEISTTIIEQDSKINGMVDVVKNLETLSSKLKETVTG